MELYLRNLDVQQSAIYGFHLYLLQYIYPLPPAFSHLIFLNVVEFFAVDLSAMPFPAAHPIFPLHFMYHQMHPPHELSYSFHKTLLDVLVNLITTTISRIHYCVNFTVVHETIDVYIYIFEKGRSGNS